jgi:hypothetical protein
MTATTDHDTCVLPAVRRAVVGLSIEDWGLNAWDFNHRVRLAAQLTLLDLSPEDVSELPKAHERMQTYYRVLDVVEQQIGGRDHGLAHLIVAMYATVRLQPAAPRP